MKTSAIAAAFCTAVLALPVQAETRDECQAMVESAVDFCTKNPADACFAAVNTGDQFKKGELFIFVFDFEGKSLANGGIPAMVGKNMLNAKSADGQPFIQKQIEVAKGGGGWLEYDWMNPATKKVQKKVSYVKKVNDSFYLGAGIHE